MAGSNYMSSNITSNHHEVLKIKDSITGVPFGVKGFSSDGSMSVNVTSGAVATSPATTGGLSTYHLVSANTTNPVNIKAAPGQVFGWFVYNSNAAARKLAFHNTAGSPTAGSSVFFAIVIPPSAGANVEFTNGIAFSAGIAITTVTDLTDAGATAVAANDLIINVFFK